MQHSAAILSRPATATPKAGRLSQLGSWPWTLVAVLGAGLLLRLSLLARPGVHPDEALYASWALRIATGSDPALLGTYVDKPPLLLYLLAGLFRLDGVFPPSFDSLILLGRLVGLVAGMASLGLLAAIAARVYDRKVALLAAALYAFSPLAVRLSPTLFTDPLLVLWMLLALWAALDRCAWLTGVACGLAYATKQQALLLIPLVLAVFLVWGQRLDSHDGTMMPGGRHPLWRLLNGFLLPFGVVLWWDSLRWQWMPSYWDRSLDTYGGLALASATALGGQLRAWGELLGYLFGSPLLTMMLAASLPLVAGLAWRRRHTRAGRTDLLIMTFFLGYVVLHLVLSFAAWDRYALPLVPVASLILARGLWHGFQQLWPIPSVTEAAPLQVPHRWRLLAVTAILLSFLHAGWLAVGPSLPAGDSSAYGDVGPLTDYLRRSQPAGTVLYQHWLGWHYQFYLHDQPLELRWWQSPADLAARALAGAGRRQLVAFPARQETTLVQQALEEAGLRLHLQWQASQADGTPALTLYRLEVLPGEGDGSSLALPPMRPGT